ncbi:MAG: hypothetical protein PVG07_02245 [Acidobacteriota bacterium]|jgi:hypothetical protein
MKKIVATSFAVLAVFALTALIALPAQAGEKVTKTGEVIDSACYISKGAKGAGHKECTEKCADAGIPLALLEDGTDEVIWLTSADHGSANDQLKPYAAQKVTITGTLSERGGAKLLVIESIEPAS